jgi:hypothetical protein
MSADTPVQSDDPDVEQSTPANPRFGLLQLFTFITAAAILLAAGGPSASGWTSVVTRLSYAITGAIAVTAASFCLDQRKHGTTILTQPGHWLLVQVAIVSLMGLAFVLILRAVVGFDTDLNSGDWTSSPGPGYRLLVAWIAISIFVNACLGVYFGRKQTERRWRWTFYTAGFGHLLMFLGELAALPVLAGALLMDRRHKLQRDLYHWCGIAVHVAHVLTTAFPTIATIVEQLIT